MTAVHDATQLAQARAQEVFLIRHGETEWSRSGRHTGLTDLPLTAHGSSEAKRVGMALSHLRFEHVLTSPLLRARSTCELAGFADRMQIEPDLAEWDYGEYEGLTSAQIHAAAPRWVVFTEGCPGGERPEQIAARVDRVIARVREHEGRVALFAHGHVLRVLVARWLGLPPSHGRHFLLDTTTLSILGYYQGAPAVKRWNAEITDKELPR